MVIGELKNELREKNDHIEHFESKLDKMESDNNRNKIVLNGHYIVNLHKNNSPPSSESIKALVNDEFDLNIQDGDITHVFKLKSSSIVKTTDDSIRDKNFPKLRNGISDQEELFINDFFIEYRLNILFKLKQLPRDDPTL